MRPRLHTGCGVPGCKKPHHAGGKCSMHYAAEKRGFRTDPTDAPSATNSPEPASDSLGNDTSVVLENGVLRKGDLIQMIGVYCPDCHGPFIAPRVRRKPEVSWCVSDRHPVFDSTGRLVRRSA